MKNIIKIIIGSMFLIALVIASCRMAYYLDYINKLSGEIAIFYIVIGMGISFIIHQLVEIIAKIDRMHISFEDVEQRMNDVSIKAMEISRRIPEKEGKELAMFWDGE